MDATQLFSKKLAILLTFALLAVAPWHAQATPAPTFVVPTSVIVPSLASQTNYPLSVTMSDGSPVAFTATVTYPNGGNAWLTLNLNGCSSTATGTTPLTIYAAAGCNAAGSSPLGNQAATITLTATGITTATITATLASSGGTGVITANPSALTMCPTYGSTQTQLVYLSTTGASVGYSITAYPSSWLTVTPSSLTVAGTNSTQLTLTASGISGNGYSTSGTILLTYNGSSTTTITVYLNVGGSCSTTTTGISVTPSPIVLSAAVGQAATSTTVTISSSISGAVSASISGLGLSYVLLSSNTITAGVPITATIYGSATNLAATTYTGALYITVNGTPQSFPVYFEVGTTSIGGIVSAVSPLSLQFNYESGKASPPAQNIMIGGSSTFSAASAMATGSGWLSTSVTSGTAPSQISVIVSPSALSASTYSGTVTVTFGDGTVQMVNVTLNVTSATPLVYASPGTVIFNQQGTTPSSAVYLYTTDSSAIPVSVTTSASWLSFISNPPTPSSAPGSFAIQANTSGLSNGLTQGNITVTYNTSTLTIPVVVYVNNGTGTGYGNLTFTPSAVSLTGQVGAAAATQVVYVGATVSSYFTAAVTSQNCNGNWLSISYTPASVYPGYAQPVTVSANPTGPTAETCTGTIAFYANGFTQTVGVTFVVSGGTLTPSPTSLAFSYNGTGAPAAQSITLTNTSSASISYTATATTTTGGSWLLFTSNQSTTFSGSVLNGAPGSLSVSVSPATLGAGTYQGTIAIAPSGGTTQNVSVTLTVTATAISATPTTLSFTYTAGGTAPGAQAISVTGGGFTAAAASTGNWLSVTPTSGTAAGTLTVSVSPSGLTAGSYTGTITVTGANGATGTVVTNVTLTVTAPLPTITFVQNAASGATGPVSPGEVITILGTNIGTGHRGYPYADFERERIHYYRRSDGDHWRNAGASDICQQHPDQRHCAVRSYRIGHFHRRS